ncbi:helix-turn-helix domain-containing protein [Agromyces sp. NPDC058136]|uniref:helix-turn-helix domain-containing protein n=1 Tax=Agromyces sp. NPDC058136 TaxID=3346354 RepID=UPI0036DCFFFF
MDPHDAKLDKLIGRNIATHRGSWSQAKIARMMVERGWQWTQTTVSNVENGSRSLKMTEAADLSSILGVTWRELMSENAEQMKALNDGLRHYAETTRALKSSLDAIQEARTHVFSLSIGVEQAGLELSELDWFRISAAIDTPIMALIEEYRLDMRSEFAKNDVLSGHSESAEGTTKTSRRDPLKYESLLLETLDKERQWAAGASAI